MSRKEERGAVGWEEWQMRIFTNCNPHKILLSSSDQAGLVWALAGSHWGILVI
jgi:hypothetical protein